MCKLDYVIATIMDVTSDPGIIPTTFKHRYFKLFISGEHEGKCIEIENGKSLPHKNYNINQFHRFLSSWDFSDVVSLAFFNSNYTIEEHLSEEEEIQNTVKILSIFEKAHRIFVLEIDDDIYTGNSAVNNKIEDLVKQIKTGELSLKDHGKIIFHMG